MGETMSNVPDDIKKQSEETQRKIKEFRAAKRDKEERFENVTKAAKEALANQNLADTPNNSAEIIAAAATTPDTYEATIQEIIESDPELKQAQDRAKESNLKEAIAATERWERVQGYKAEAKEAVQRQKKLNEMRQREQEAATLLGEEGLEKVRREIEEVERERHSNKEKHQEEASIIVEPEYEKEAQQAEAQEQEAELERQKVAESINAESAQAPQMSERAGFEQYQQLLESDRLQDLAETAKKSRERLARKYGISDADEYARGLLTSSWSKVKHAAKMIRPGFRVAWNNFVRADKEYDALLKSEKLPDVKRLPQTRGYESNRDPGDVRRPKL
ncbi:hypothetical protein KKF05_04590 [Patescibacteria group bacterium]|nr:hypothetical protein [Patescibacteria group bacterium]